MIESRGKLLHELKHMAGVINDYDDLLNVDCESWVILDALELLKEQEDMTRFVIDDFQPTCKACGFHPLAGYIPTLEWIRERGFKFCPRCGRPVKWE